MIRPTLLLILFMLIAVLPACKHGDDLVAPASTGTVDDNGGDDDGGDDDDDDGDDD
jgi:hypothetical protein